MSKIQIKTKLVPDYVEKKITELYALGLSQTTIHNSIKRLARECFGSTIFDPKQFLDPSNHQKVIDFIKSTPSASHLAYVLHRILEFFDLTDAQKLELIKYHQFQKTIIRSYSEAGERDLEVIGELTEAKLDQIRMRHYKMAETTTDLVTYRYHVVLEIYSQMVPMRQSDLICAKVVNFDKGCDLEAKTAEVPNFLCLNNGKLVNTTYKTSKAYGIKVMEVPQSLIPIIKKWQAKFPSEWLLRSTNSAADAMTSANVNACLGAILGKNVGPNMLTKIFNARVTFDSKTTVKEREDIARQRGHSVATQVLQYATLSKVIHPTEPKQKIPLKKKGLIQAPISPFVRVNEIPFATLTKIHY